MGDILLILFPFADAEVSKLRPAVLITQTADKYGDVVVSAINSQVPEISGKNEIVPEPASYTGLRTKSVLKVDRIATVRRSRIQAKIGKLNIEDLEKFRNIFKELL